MIVILDFDGTLTAEEAQALNGATERES